MEVRAVVEAMRAPVTIPTDYPSDVPEPDTFELMTVMTSDDAIR